VHGTHPYPRSLPLGTPAVSRQVDHGCGWVRRISLRETSGSAAAELEFYDGTNDAGALLDSISLSAGQSTRDYYRVGEYPYEGGLYLDVLSGTFTGTVVVQFHRRGDPWGEPVILINPEVLSVNVTPPA
jgi:hypothetical protein